jgi:thiamine pyrophosphate-dependent acetolactate synthase large subunit-like protein
LPTPSQGVWASDVMADMLRRLDLPYVTLNPGASFRGLHDSLVNHIGNARPQMLLCLHEEHAVAIAHGWAKVTERPMAAILHSNVGLMHATMAIFNAWCDRVPMLLLGATGPVDAAKRRPWIDWIHTAKDQGALVRPYTKWDDQPASVPALVESLLRANVMAQTAPRGPTYVCLDAGLQETKIDALPDLPDPARYQPPAAGEPARPLIEAAAKLLCGAQRPVILAGRVGRSEAAWATRIRLAEALEALVITDLKTAASFPTSHRLHGAPAGTFLSPRSIEVLHQADVVLSLDWVDLAGTLKTVWGANEIKSKVVQISVDQYVHNGWSMDHQGLPPVDLNLMSEPDPATVALLDAIERLGGAKQPAWPGLRAGQSDPVFPGDAPPDRSTITVPLLAAALRESVAGVDTCLIRGPLSWAGHLWPIEHPLDYLGIDGGGGIGSGPGIAIGAALALQGTGRLPIMITGDGDLMMAVSALWTGVHYRIPLLIIVANNQSFFNDELHQERMARQRGRLIANKWIGQRIADPDIDFAMAARAQGAVGIGPVREPSDLAPALRDALDTLRQGHVVVVDVRVQPGYDPNTTRVMMQGTAAPAGRGASAGRT